MNVVWDLEGSLEGAQYVLGSSEGWILGRANCTALMYA